MTDIQTRGAGGAMIDNAFGDALQRILDQHRITQSQLGRRADLDPSLVSRWITGTRHPSLDSIEVMMPVLARAGVSVGDRRRLFLFAGYAPPDLRDELIDWAETDFAALRVKLEAVAKVFGSLPFVPEASR